MIHDVSFSPFRIAVLFHEIVPGRCAPFNPALVVACCDPCLCVAVGLDDFALAELVFVEDDRLEECDFCTSKADGRNSAITSESAERGAS
jgi:hypothetical protein